MCEAVLEVRCCGALVPAEAAGNPAAAPQLFLSCGTHRCGESALPGACTLPRRALTGGSTAESLFRLKEILDGLDVSSVRVLTCTRGHAVLRARVRLLFTAAYTFDYRITGARGPTCTNRTGHAHRGSPDAGGHEEEGGGVEGVEGKEGVEEKGVEKEEGKGKEVVEEDGGGGGVEEGKGKDGGVEEKEEHGGVEEEAEEKKEGGVERVEEEEEKGEEEVSSFLQRLPAVKGEVTTLLSPLIPDCFGHGFSTRTGGITSIPTLSSLNLFCSGRRKDPVAVVTENRRRLAVHAGFHPRPLLMVKVNHGSDVWVVGKAEPASYDSVVTDRAGVVLAAPGADCMPLLFADPVSKVIGAAHAGYKGTLMGVAVATVEAMVTEFGCRRRDIVVAVGPSVGGCCFTLDKNQALLFQKIHPETVPDPESEKPHVDIRRANRVLLQKAGVRPENIHDNLLKELPCVTPCTSCHPDDFFSHVRDGNNFGTQIGFLWIKEKQLST